MVGEKGKDRLGTRRLWISTPALHNGLGPRGSRFLLAYMEIILPALKFMVRIRSCRLTEVPNTS